MIRSTRRMRSARRTTPPCAPGTSAMPDDDEIEQVPSPSEEPRADGDQLQHDLGHEDREAGALQREDQGACGLHDRGRGFQAQDHGVEDDHADDRVCARQGWSSQAARRSRTRTVVIVGGVAGAHSAPRSDFPSDWGQRQAGCKLHMGRPAELIDRLQPNRGGFKAPPPPATAIAASRAKVTELHDTMASAANPGLGDLRPISPPRPPRRRVRFTIAVEARPPRAVSGRRQQIRGFPTVTAFKAPAMARGVVERTGQRASPSTACTSAGGERSAQKVPATGEQRRDTGCARSASVTASRSVALARLGGCRKVAGRRGGRDGAKMQGRARRGVDRVSPLHVSPRCGRETGALQCAKPRLVKRLAAGSRRTSIGVRWKGTRRTAWPSGEAGPSCVILASVGQREQRRGENVAFRESAR